MYPQITGLAVPALLFTSLLPQEAQAPPPAGPDLGGKLVVNGVEIPELEIQRHLVYGPCRPALEWRRIGALIDFEIAQRAREGQDVSRLQISDEAFQKHLKKKLDEFVERYPMLELETEVGRAYRNMKWYERELRQEMIFDEVFVPDDPALWPDLTFEALRMEAGEILINDFKESYDRRVKGTEEARAEWQAKQDAGEDPGPFPELYPEDSMYRSILRQIVRDLYYQAVDTKTAKDALPAELVCTMDMDWDGVSELEVRTAEIWDSVKDTVTPKEVADVRLMLALLESTRQKLQQEGKLISDEESRSLLEAMGSGFTSNLFDLSQIAVGGHQFPSVESYTVYFPLLESHKRVTEAQLQTEDGSLAPELREHLNTANKVMGLAKTDAEVLLVSAFDFNNDEWKEGGWEWAEQQAQFLMKEYKANEEAWTKQREAQLQGTTPATDGAGEEPLDPNVFWSLMLDDHCEFWDPPQPVEGRPGSAVGYKQKGRFGERTRNDFRSLMSESPFTHYLYGDMLTDYVFFDQPIGVVEGPFLGPFGYYLTKVLSRTPPQRPLNVRNERHVELLRDDYVRQSFVWYSHQALKESEVEGLPK